MQKNRILTCITAFFIGFLSINAQADGVTALQNLKNNMSAARISTPFDIRKVTANPTLIKGIYVLEDKGTHIFRMFINEGGTIFGSGNGWQKITQPMGDLSSSDINQLRKEVLKNIDTDKLIKVRYGDGGDRRLVLYSAVDCPASSRLESNLRSKASSLNTTFYVLPASLQPAKTTRGKQNWQTAANLACDKERSAWINYWKNPQPIAGQRCELSAFDAASNADYFRAILRSVGINIQSSPSILREDGVLQNQYSNDSSSSSALSAMALDNQPLHWLAKDNNTNAAPNIDLGGVINKFFFKK